MAQKNRYAKPVLKEAAEHIEPSQPAVAADVVQFVGADVGVHVGSKMEEEIKKMIDMHPGFPVEHVDSDLEKAMAIVKALAKCSGDEQYQRLKNQAEALVLELA